MLTIFAVPKAFQGHIGIIQRNAIKSWTLIRPRPEILLLGADPGTKEVAFEFGVRHCPNIDRNELGTPLVSHIFDTAEKEATNSLLCYVNSDVILPTSLSETIAKVRLPNFLIIGRRWDLDIGDLLDFEDMEWEKKLNDFRVAHAKLHASTGIDYFIFPRGCYKEIPPFAIGRTVWDNWLVYKARLSAIPVMDATQVLTVIHQNHDYGISGGAKAIWTGVEASTNLELAGGYSCMFDLNAANFVLSPTGMKRQPFTRNRMERELHLYTKRHPEFAFWIRLVEKILKPSDLWHSIRARAKRIFADS